MSPITSFLAFNPLIKLIQPLQYPGFAFRIPVPDSKHLPSCASTILVLWEEHDSDEPCGCYKCKVSDYLSDRSALLSYPDGATEFVNLAEVSCQFARKSGRNYYSPLCPPPHLEPLAHHCSKSIKFSRSSEH